VRLAYSTAAPVPIFYYLLGDRIQIPESAKESLYQVDLLEPLFVQIAFKREIPLNGGSEDGDDGGGGGGGGGGIQCCVTGNYIKDCFRDGSLSSFASHCECSFVCRSSSRNGDTGIENYVRVSFVVKYGYPLHAVLDKAYPPDTWVVLDFGGLSRAQVTAAYRRNLRCLGVLNRSDQRTCANISGVSGCCDALLTVASCSCMQPSTFFQTLTVTESVYAALVVCGNGWVAEYLERPVVVPWWWCCCCCFCVGGSEVDDTTSVPSQTHLTCSGATFMTFHDMMTVVGGEHATSRPNKLSRRPGAQEDHWSSSASASSSSSYVAGGGDGRGSPVQPSSSPRASRGHPYGGSVQDYEAARAARARQERHRKRDYARFSPSDLYRMMVNRATSSTYFVTNYYARQLMDDPQRKLMMHAFSVPIVSRTETGPSHGLASDPSGKTSRTGAPRGMAAVVPGAPTKATGIFAGIGTAMAMGSRASVNSMGPATVPTRGVITVTAPPELARTATSGSVDSPQNIILARLAAYRQERDNPT
jgi:hypothetical protein